MLLFQRIVAQNNVKPLILHGGNGLDRSAAGQNFITLPFQNELVGQQDGSFVVNYQHAVFTISTHNFTTGKSILKVVPRPIRLFTESLPAWFWIIPFTIQRPSPVPRSPLVVTNGSKIERIISGGMPEPVSAIRMRTQPWRSSTQERWRLRIRSLHRFGLA